MLPEPVCALAADQAGVVALRQLLALGLAPHDVRRWVRRRELVRLHRGVYLVHTGEPTWRQRAWAAVLLLEPAALCHESALRLVDGGALDRGGAQAIHVAVAHGRRVETVAPAILVHRKRDLDARVLWHLAPPRQRYEDAALDVAVAAPDELAAIAVLAGGIQRGRTTAARLLTVSRARPRVAGRAWLEAVLSDIADGTCSALEHGYLVRVERPHGLPPAMRQTADLAGAGRVYRDVDYGRLLVELDGRLHHDTALARDRDMERDLDAAVDGRDTVRLSWGQVFDRPCSTAVKVAALLQQRGWRGHAVACGPGCAAALAA